LWAQLGLWLTESERQFAPKETLKTESGEAANGTHRTLRKSRWAAENGPEATLNQISVKVKNRHIILDLCALKSGGKSLTILLG
jgi:hypothetical protein